MATVVIRAEENHLINKPLPSRKVGTATQNNTNRGATVRLCNERSLQLTLTQSKQPRIKTRNRSYTDSPVKGQPAVMIMRKSPGKGGEIGRMSAGLLWDWTAAHSVMQKHAEVSSRKCVF